MTPLPQILAQSESGGIFFWSVVLIFFVVVLFFVLLRVRKWMRDEAFSSGEGFTLADLRELHREGKMSDEEFNRAKQQFLVAMKTQKPPAAEAGQQKDMGF